jgi:inosine/xanthosine triphosphatase
VFNLKVVVGSTNPVKINATKKAFSRFFDDIEVIGINVDSGVSEMPISRSEIINGAINRAKKSLENADYGVGLEGGTHETKYGMLLMGVTAIISKNGEIGLGNTEGFILPEMIAKRIRNGEELGPVMDDIINEKDTKKKLGAVGIFTKGQITRTDSFEQSVIIALIKFINPQFYNNN